jgi:hypothetical protein
VPAGRRRKTLPQRVRLQRWGALAATVVVTTAVALPAASALGGSAPAAQTTAATRDRPVRVAQRAAPRTVSRDFVRPQLVAARRLAATPRVVAPAVHLRLRARWATAPLNVMAAPRERARVLTVLHAGGRVQATGTVRGPWAQVRRDGRVAWVHRAFLSAHKPARPADNPQAFAGGNGGTGAGGGGGGGGSVSGAPCPDGSAVESGLVSHTIEVYRAVCAAFPAVSAWGGRSGDGDHGSGHALDIMCSGSLGDAIAAYVRAHAGELGVSYVIWAQHIWSVERAGEGWRSMSDRGSSTANHYDHVHVSVF